MLNYSTCFGRPSRPSSGEHKTVVAASGTDHTTWEASFFIRDQIRTYLVTTNSRTNKCFNSIFFNPLTPNNPYSGRAAPLTSKRCILYIYSTNIGTEYFKHGIYSPFLSLQNSVCFIILTYLVPVLFTFYIQGVLKLK